MKFRLVSVALAGLVLALASVCIAQPVARVSVSAAAPRSIIVKFRTEEAMSDPALLSKLTSISATSDVLQPVFRQPKRGMQVQSVASNGLDRIVKITLKAGMTAQDAVRTLAHNTSVEYAEPNYIYHVDGVITPNDSLYNEQWWLQNIHAPEAWEITKGDSTIHIGFVDTGVDWWHPDLQFQFAINRKEDINGNGLFDPWPSDSIGTDAHGHLVHGDIDGIDHDGNGYANDVIGYNFVDQESQNVGTWSGRSPYPWDENGHGTMVAGVLAAEQNNHIGVSGIAPKCKLVALRAFDATGNGEDDDIASAIVYAADNHIQILNCSFGDIVPSLLQRDAIRYATSMGTLVFASSGNDGGDRPHYPSDFDEVVGVGATTNNPAPDNLFAFTSHGEGMDMVAPGDDIITTKFDNTYTQTQGTSFSSPIAAGVAALLLSQHPNYGPLELRSVLESATQDILAKGYDHESANGRVDALRALNYVGGAAIKITSLHTMDQIHIGDNVQITGSAASTLFTNYEVDYAYAGVQLANVHPDTNPLVNNWQPIKQDTSQILDGLLAAWNTHGLRPGFYVIRLAVASTDNRSTEEHIIIWLSNNDPSFVSVEVDTIYVNDRRGLLIKAVSDEPCTFRVDASGGGASISKADDHAGFEHAVVLKSEDIASGIALTLEIYLTTPAGDIAPDEEFATIPNEGISEVGFTQKPYSLPAGYALDSVLSMPTGDEVIESVFPDGLNFGPLKVFSFDGKKFMQVDSLPDAWIPRALGNTKGDSKPELLVQVGDSTRLYKQNASHDILGDVLFHDSVWGGVLADLDKSGKDAIIGYGGRNDNIYAHFVGKDYDYIVPDSIYYAYKWNGSGYDVSGRMPNNSPVDHYYNQSNQYSEPNAAHADLAGDGFQDLITLDNDADLIVYEYDATSPTKFKTIYTEAHDGQAEGSLVTTGDFDGDGKPDIAYAWHTVFSNDSLGEYAPGAPQDYWTVKVLRNLGGMKFETIYFDHFYYAKPLTPYRSSVQAIRNVTGGSVDDLVLSLFPNFYLLEYDANSHQMKPIWHYPISASPRGAIAYDFDRNGKREFGFVAGDSIRFFERDTTYATRTPAPGGLNASPRDVDRVDLDWGTVTGAQKYYILRAAQGDNHFTLIDTTRVATYSDRDVNDGDILLYAVAAVDSLHAIPVSEASFPMWATVHAIPQLTRVDGANAKHIRIHTSQVLRTNLLSAGSLIIDDTLTPSSVAVAGDSLLDVGFSLPIPPGAHFARAHSFELRDTLNSPFDTVSHVTWNIRPDSTPDRFYIVRWNFEQLASGVRIHVIFSEPPAASADDASHYSLSPYGTLIKVSPDPSNPNALYIDVGSDMKLIALGVPFVLCVKNIVSATNTPLDAQEGDCVGVSFTEPTLANVMVYPNPAKQSDGQLTFSRLTSQADIRIYTIGMRFIRAISTTEQLGGVVWDMRDDQGKIVPSGEYLYFATGKDEFGTPVVGQAAKLVIINDK